MDGSGAPHGFLRGCMEDNLFLECEFEHTRIPEIKAIVISGEWDNGANNEFLRNCLQTHGDMESTQFV